MHYVVPIIEEAWEHRRRRHRLLGIGVLAAAVVAAAVVFMARGPGSIAGSSGPAPLSGNVVAPSAVLSKPPYMGVSCPVANSIACDRVGLAVWLKRPAVSVHATIAGARLSLHTGGQAADNMGTRGRAFVGYLKPAGIASRLHVRPVEGNVISTAHGRTRVTVTPQMWFGDGQVPPASVRLTIQYGGGRTAHTQLRVPLSAGWG